MGKTSAAVHRRYNDSRLQANAALREMYPEHVETLQGFARDYVRRRFGRIPAAEREWRERGYVDRELKKQFSVQWKMLREAAKREQKETQDAQ